MPRIYAVNRIGEFPYTMTVGLAERDYLTGWWINLGFIITGALILDVLLGIYLFRQQRMTRQLVENEEKLKLTMRNLTLVSAAVEKANDIVIITQAEPIDLKGPEIVYVNQAFVNETGYSVAEALGKTPRILQGAHTDARSNPFVKSALEMFGGRVVKED